MKVERVGVAGAGTMGTGIAQLACLGQFETFLHDPDRQALDAAEERLRSALARGADRGRWSADAAQAAGDRLRRAAGLDDLGVCELVIEAAPEDIGLKCDLLASLAELCAPGAILATNTSSLSVTAIAAAVANPRRVCGLHFFNPPAAMRLVEVVAGDQSSEDVLLAASEVAERMGRVPVRARDEIGFIANRCARPFSLEALRMLGDRIATAAQIDAVVRRGGGFRMGPFELMDLVGVDVGFEVAKSFWEQSFHEPRWQPHPIQARMAAAGRLGRKSGGGYYDYTVDPHRPADPRPTEPPPVDVTTWDGDGSIDLDAGTQRAVLSRIVCQLVNEAAFALQKGIGSAEDIDTAMRLGLNWPRGPLAWGDAIGPTRVLGVLDELYSALGEERYRAAPLLRHRAADGRPLAGY